MNKYIHPLQQHYTTNSLAKKQHRPIKSFKAVFDEVSDIKVSKHAEVRMKERNITIPSDTWTKVTEKMKEAERKGVTDALIILEEVALVVSTKNNTVVTAIAKAEANERIFTNINGTIFI